MAATRKRATTTPASPAPKRVAALKKPTSRRAAEPKPKGPTATIKKLETALDGPDDAAQCMALHEQLGKLQRRRVAKAAADVLAFAEKGGAIARAYLAVLATDDAVAANRIAAHCARLVRGRKAMRGVFVATWERASDQRAVDDAFRNFAREILDDPELLAAGVEVARRLGRADLVAERDARLARAKRLAPLVAKLTAEGRNGSPPSLEALADGDLRHVYARVLGAPRRFDDALAVTAIAGLINDGDTPDMTLSAAITELTEDARATLIAQWKARVAAGEVALIARLLELFEWTGLWATDATQLAPFIHALHPAGGRPDVFAQVDNALASERPVVRAAVLETWLRHGEGLAAFGDAQVDTLMRSAIAIAESDEDAPDRHAAHRALHDVGHPGARGALMDAIAGARSRSRELRGNLYHGLSHIRHPAITPFLIDRLFVERAEYGVLLDALAHDLDLVTHRGVLATLLQRAREPDAVHAAVLYVELLVDKKPSSRMICELARVLLDWQPRSTDDGRRLRYLYERATVAAVAIASFDDARTFLGRARALPDRPYSDYRVLDQKTATPLPLADPRVAALESGQLERDFAAARAAADAARAKATPIAADDTRLCELAGCTTVTRMLDDRQRCVAWFFDEVDELHVYDGFAIVPPAFRVVRGLGGGELAAFLAGKTIIDERVTHRGADRVREVIRLGDRMLVFSLQVPSELLGVKLAGYVAARDAVARFAASPPAGMARVDSWRGVRRTYQAQRAGQAHLAVAGARIDGPIGDGFPPLERAHADPAAAVKALQAWEGRVFAAGGHLVTISFE